MKFGIKTSAVIGVAAVVGIASVAQARHSWGKYEWAYDGTPIDVPVVDNTTGDWGSRVSLAVTDWNKSSRISAAKSNGSNTACNFVTGTIQVCNDSYCDTGWLGIASISINGNEIIAGYTMLNDSYFSQPQYNTESWKQLVTCQEIGHDYGLAHQNENFMTDQTTSCMEYTSWPAGNEHPDQHDYDQLESMYSTGSTKGGGGGGGSGKPKGKPQTLPNVGRTPESWGRPIGYLPNGKPNIYERNMGSYRVITHVTWTLEAAAEMGDHHGGHHD